MRNAVLYTKTPIEMEKCLYEIKKVYKGASGNEKQILVGKPPKSLYIWFPSTDLSDPVEAAEMIEDIDKIPFENPHFTHIDFHTLKSLQSVVNLIVPIYPEVIIWTDEDKFYSATDFCRANFD